MSGDANEQQALSLPQGGGAISGIGETFKADLFSGTGNFSVPIFASPARGLTPSLNLAYSSGSGNGPFGLGWQISIPRVTRKTEKGLPRYDDRDTFVMSGAEDLVPVPDPPLTCGAFAITRYRPRTEDQFARIERWVRSDGDTHWRAITPNNVTSIYGRTPDARIADPDNPRHVYEWLLQETFDAKGNHVLYEYAREDATAVPASLSERNRTYNQIYIRHIFYGNSHEMVGPRKRGIDHTNPLVEIERSYLMELFFDYGDLQDGTPVYNDQPERVTSAWALRTDPFSTYRAGFEVRTLRLCQRVVMFHHFSELGGATKVKSTDLAYSVDPNTQITFLTSVTVTSYRCEGSSYRWASMPPVTFQYSQFRPHEQRYQSVAVEGDLLPAPLNSQQISLVDLFGKGLPDVLETTPGGFRYWRNLGGGHLARPRMMANAPSSVTLDQPDVRFADMNGNGRADLLVLNDEIHGFYETDGCGGWQRFKPIPHMPSFNLADPNARLLDLTGDGLTDVLVTSDRHFLWFECLGQEGYAAPRAVPRVHDLDQFPDVYFDDPSGRVRLADMNGDGLTDIVLLHNGRVDYWPNLGHGRFDKRITMANAPRLGLQSNFDPARLHLADVDGEGCADLVYVDRDCVRFWFNCSGNGWSAENVISGTPSVTNQASVEFVDLFGTGTATLVWSYDPAYQPGGNYKALDFCAGIKPYLLTEMRNNMGMTTRTKYVPSTQFYLEDEANREPWLTRLPFPIHVLARTESFDHISQIKSVTTYKYHHGYYDGREREFRGFGRVDQFDTVAHDDFNHGLPAANGQATYYVPPVETRTWFHTGIYFDTIGAGATSDYADLTARYCQAYYQGDPQAFTLGEHTVEIGTTPHEAYRTLRGAILRTEVYSHDGTPQAAHPYQATEQRYHVRMVQPQDGAHPPVYLTIPAESLSYQYERKPNDPRISHVIALDVDSYNNITDSVTIYYPRRAPLLPEQAGLKIVYTHTDFINRPDAAAYYIGVPFQTRTYEITGVLQPTPATLLDTGHFTAVTDDPGDFLPYHAQPDGTTPQKRLIEWNRIYFRVDAEPDLLDAPGSLAHRLPLGQIDPLGLPYETYDAALTDAHIALVYSSPALVTPAILQEGGYHQEADVPGYWWIPGGKQAFDPGGFYHIVRIQNAFGAISHTVYDRYDLLAERTIDPLGNAVQGANDYRTLRPYQVTDINGNIIQIAFDTLGLVAGMAVLGKGQEGDSLANFSADITQEQLDAVYQTGGDVSLLGSATTRYVYDLHAYRLRGKPTLTLAINRETHQAHLATGQTTHIQRQVTYSDGSGRPVLTKAQAEPGEVNGVYTEHRWVGTGFTIYNNKGQPVQKYEPFFSNTHEYEYGRQVGVSSTSFYDPIGRVMATLHPNGTYGKVVFDAWAHAVWDTNDTVLLDPRTDPDVGGFMTPYLQTIPGWQTWFEALLPGYDPNNPPANLTLEQKAAIQARAHANTPTVTHLDVQARPFVAVVHNGSAGQYTAKSVLDIEGNQLALVDAKGRTIMRCEVNLLGVCIHQISMEAGERWSLDSAEGEVIRAWDSRGYKRRIAYDVMRRQNKVFIGLPSGAEILAGKTEYGEGQPDAANANLRGKPFRTLDEAGVETHLAYDFKGNLLHSQVRLLANYKEPANWSASPALEGEIFTSRIRYDAMNRMVQCVGPYSSLRAAMDVTQFSYNRAGLLECVDVWLQRATEPADLLDAATADLHAVTNIDYNVKGQRDRIAYGNGVQTMYTYDPLTLRMIRMRTRRGTDYLQDLSYVYDPAGNITSIRDDAQQTVFFRNQVVEPHMEYVYDAAYRLIEATGREHLGQTGDQCNAPTPSDPLDTLRTHLDHPSNGEAMGRYREIYQYDTVGNLEMLRHLGTDPNHPGWTRTCVYNEPSLLESSKTNNRLTRNVIGSTTETYTYDAHGNITQMPHLPLMRWDSADQLQASARQVRTDGGAPETTYYVYGAGGQRVRKVTERQAAPGQAPTRMKERIYLSGFEVYREFGAAGTTVTLERETRHVMDNQQRIVLVETRTRGDDGSPAQLARYQFSNHLGSATLELDADAQVISYEEYYPYGSTAYQAVRTDVQVPLKRYRYVGKERDEETGLSYHGARYYAPWLGRWISADPAGTSGGVNFYNYARSNPVMYEDPDGSAPRLKLPIGTSGPYSWLKREGRALWRGLERLSEDEHCSAFGILKRILRKSEKSQKSVIGKEEYLEMQALRIPYDMARIKTKRDLEIMRLLDEARKTGKMSEELTRISRPEYAIDIMIEAREITRQQRIAKGLSTADLDVITNEAIENTVVHQIRKLDEAGKGQSIPSALARATKGEINDAVNMLGEGKVGAAALILPLVASSQASAAPTQQAGATQPAAALFPSYQKTVDAQLGALTEVTAVAAEDSPSDVLSYAATGALGIKVMEKSRIGRATIDLASHPGMVFIENAPYMFNPKTGDVYAYSGSENLKQIGHLGSFSGSYGGDVSGEKAIIFAEAGKYYIWR